jgi:hypothetical protein
MCPFDLVKAMMSGGRRTNDKTPTTPFLAGLRKLIFRHVDFTELDGGGRSFFEILSKYLMMRKEQGETMQTLHVYGSIYRDVRALGEFVVRFSSGVSSDSEDETEEVN